MIFGVGMSQALTYYNEFDAHAAEWTRNLIEAGYISPGVVDERDIRDVEASDVVGYRRAHFFSGISGWDLALRLAGWPDDRPVWTGSCPCQPYSSAGKGLGDADARNLWPEFFRLIRECRPDTIFSEQVSSAIGHGWLDGISADLEGEGYAVGSIVLGAHCVGSPHIRQRLYWVADAQGHDQWGARECGAGVRRQELPTGGYGPVGWRTADPASPWSNFDLIACRDGKSRRVESGSFPLVARFSFRLADGRTREGVSRAACLKGIGNAIVPQVAAEFIRAYLEATGVDR